MGSNPAKSGSYRRTFIILLLYYIITKLCQFTICSLSDPSTLYLLLKRKNKVEEFTGIPGDKCGHASRNPLFQKPTHPYMNKYMQYILRTILTWELIDVA